MCQSNPLSDERIFNHYENSIQSVGLIGTGLVGMALTRRLTVAGMQVRGYDIDLESCKRFGNAGGLIEETAEAVARCERIVFLSLPDGNSVKRVIDTIEKILIPGSVIVDTTTSTPAEVEAMAARLRKAGVGYVDATISGSSEVIAGGQATWMIGAAEADFLTVRELIEKIGGEIFHIGPTGSGTRMKLVSNLILGLNRAVLAEGLVLAEAWGMNMNQALEVLKASAAYSRVMDAKGQKMIQRDYSPQARLKQHHKDVTLILQCAAELNMHLQLSELHDKLLLLAETKGLGQLDNSAIIEVMRSQTTELQ